MSPGSNPHIASKAPTMKEMTASRTATAAGEPPRKRASAESFMGKFLWSSSPLNLVPILSQTRVDRLESLRARAKLCLGQGVKRPPRRFETRVQIDRFIVHIDQPGYDVRHGTMFPQHRHSRRPVAPVVIRGELVEAD